MGGGMFAALRSWLWAVVTLALIVAASTTGYFVWSMETGRAATAQADDQFNSVAENRETWTDHHIVTTWIAHCLGAAAPENLPEATRWALEPPYRSFNTGTEQSARSDITSQQYAVASLSNALFS